MMMTTVLAIRVVVADFDIYYLFLFHFEDSARYPTFSKALSFRHKYCCSSTGKTPLGS